MNRIDARFSKLKKQRRKAFIAFLTAGDPSLKVTEELVLAFAAAGVDMVELGVPFSDPMADGPTIQAASERSLKKGTTLAKILDLVRRIRMKSDLPLALMTYYNPVFHQGEAAFVERAKRAGVDGLIIPDLPPEEAAGLIQATQRNDMACVFFIAPTSKAERMKRNARASSGFIYYVSLTGVTGARKALPDSLKSQLRLAKKITTKPICVGFGISTPGQVRQVGRLADGVIVGSAIIKEIEKNKGNKNLVSNVTKFVQRLRKAL